MDLKGEDKEIITEFLEKSGFIERGKDQFYKRDVGAIFVREWRAEAVFAQIIELGKQHQAKNIRDALMIKAELFDTVVFNPLV